MTAQRMRFVLSLAAIGFVAALLAIIGLLDLPQSMRDLAMIIAGVVLATFKDVYAFYFGSSDGSKEKTLMLATRPDGTAEDPVHVEDDTLDLTGAEFPTR